MKTLNASIGLASVLLLASCMPATGGTDGASMSSSSASVMVATAEGTLQKSGISIYMQGSHQLVTETGELLLLESTTIDLDDYVDARVRVIGIARKTVEEGGMILSVEEIERLESDGEILVEVDESSSSSQASSASSVSSASSEYVSSSSVSSAKPSSSSSESVQSSSVSSVASSSAASVSAVDADAAVSAMARFSVEPARFTQKYCSTHIGFCIPIHKNWYYQSFGANVAPYLWHVEIGPVAVEEEGQGVIMVNLVSGSLPTGAVEGSAVAQGEYVVAYKQWTGNRYFQITAAASLKASVEYIANGLEVYQTTE